MTPNLFSQLIADKHITPCRFAGHIWLADGCGALYHPNSKTLIISDLHIGKGSYLKRHGNPIPTFDTETTLALITQLLKRYTPVTLVCLGDSFHDLQAGERLSKSQNTTLHNLIAQVERWIWVLGNHDPDIPAQFAGERVIDYVLDDVLLTHEPVTFDEVADKRCRAQIMGHFHPKASLSVRGHQMTGKCFYGDDQHLIMPAIGAYTGGLNIDDEVYDTILPNTSELIVLCYQQKAYLFDPRQHLK